MLRCEQGSTGGMLSELCLHPGWKEPLAVSREETLNGARHLLSAARRVAKSRT